MASFINSYRLHGDVTLATEHCSGRHVAGVRITTLVINWLAISKADIIEVQMIVLGKADAYCI